MTVVFKFLEVTAEKTEEVEIDFSDVVLAAESMQSYEVSTHSAAEPVSGFGLDKPMLPAFAVGEAPEVHVAGDVE